MKSANQRRPPGSELGRFISSVINGSDDTDRSVFSEIDLLLFTSDVPFLGIDFSHRVSTMRRLTCIWKKSS